MSIIFDALRKVQRNLKEAQAKDVITPPVPKNAEREADAGYEPQDSGRPTPPAPSTAVPERKDFSPPSPPGVRPEKLAGASGTSPFAVPPPTRPVIRPPEGHDADKEDRRQRMEKNTIIYGTLICLGLIGLIISLFAIFFQSHERPRETGQEVIVQGIMTQKDRQVVLINDRIYEVGETINGMRIVGIALDSIQVLQGGRIKTLKITPP